MISAIRYLVAWYATAAPEVEDVGRPGQLPGSTFDNENETIKNHVRVR